MSLQSLLLYTAVVLSCFAHQVLAQKHMTSDVPPYLDLINPQYEYDLQMNAYDSDGLEPHMDFNDVLAHHWGVTDKYRRHMNKALKAFNDNEPENKLVNSSIVEIIRNLDRIPEKYRTNIEHFGGGYINHCLYWSCMSPAENITQKEPKGWLKADIERQFGTLQAFKEKFTAAATNVFGSGYVWLSRMTADKDWKLILHTTENQDCPLTENLFPLLVIDVWEHAYYLKHQSRLVDYVEEWWNLVDWGNVEKLDNWWQDKFPEMSREQQCI